MPVFHQLGPCLFLFNSLYDSTISIHPNLSFPSFSLGVIKQFLKAQELLNIPLEVIISILDLFDLSLLPFKGTLSRGFLRFWAKRCMKSTFNIFSLAQNTPTTSKEGNQMIFSKEEQTIVSYWRFFQGKKEKLENTSLMFSRCNHFHPSDQQPNTLYYSLRELVE